MTWMLNIVAERIKDFERELEEIKTKQMLVLFTQRNEGDS